MRCDRLTPVIFRAAGSIFASRSALRRARFHTRPPAGTSAAKSRSARPAACPRVAIVESRNARYSLQILPIQIPSPLPLLATLSAPDTLHSATNPPARNLDHHRTKSRLHDLTTNQRPLDLHTHRNHRITIVLSSLPEPLTPCTFTPSATLSMPQNRPRTSLHLDL